MSSMSAGCRTRPTQSLQTTMPFTNALVDERSAVISAMPRQSFVSVRQLRRNFDDGRPSAEGHPRWHNQPGWNPSYSVVIGLCRRGSTLGPGGPSPQFVAGPQIFEGFPIFIADIVFVMIWRGPVARPHRILGLEPRHLAQWTSHSHAARNAVHYYRNHSLDGAT